MRKIITTLTLLLPLCVSAQLKPDPQFGNNGLATSHETDRAKVIQAMALQSDGAIVSAGMDYELDGQLYYQTEVQRNLPNGSPDMSFGTAGHIILNTGNKNTPVDIAIQADGKILVAGSETIIETLPGNPPPTIIRSQPFIARFLKNGTLDVNFGNNGIHHLDILSSFQSREIAAIEVLPDGRIVAGGSCRSTLSRIVLVCLKPDGTYDQNFGNAGYKTYMPEPAVDAILTDLKLQSGKLLLTGASGDLSITTLGITKWFAGRVNTDGNLDVGFGTQGFSLGTFGNGNVNIAAAMVADGQNIYLTGNAGGKFALVSLLANGQLNQAFSTGGILIDTANVPAQALALQGNKLYAAGVLPQNQGNGTVRLSAYNTNGTADLAFGTNGRFTTAFFAKDYVYDLCVQPDGKFVIGGGYRDVNNEQGSMLARFANENTGVARLKANDLFKVYPNPATSVINLSVKKDLAGKGQVQILAVDGTVIEKRVIDAGDIKIDLKDMPAGVYTIMVEAGEEVMSEVFIKQ